MFSYYPESIPENMIVATRSYLENKVPWRRVTYYSNKRKGTVRNPRATWVCGFHKPYLYNVRNIKPNSFPRELHALIRYVQDFTQSKYNFLLFSKYTSGQDSITWHADDEKFITPGSPITSLTILDKDADSRTFYLKNLKTKRKHAWNLNTGDIFKMDYECQKHYHHAILKQPNLKGNRYSITFRHAANELGTKNYYTYN